jgi:hypothetical protein
MCLTVETMGVQCDATRRGIIYLEKRVRVVQYYLLFFKLKICLTRSLLSCES